MKIKINVIDLDKTLIPYDSFRILIKKEIFKLNLVILFYSIYRFFGWYSGELYKQKVLSVLIRKYTDSYYKEFALKLYNDIDVRVVHKIQLETKENTLNVLVSASPNLYVKHLIDKLGWMGSGSYFNDKSNFIHLHGKGKIFWLEENFNKKIFDYNMAISDSSTDNNLLTLFNRGIKWISV